MSVNLSKTIMSSKIDDIYIELCKAYGPITREVVSALMFSSSKAERPKVMFPPNEGSTFDAQIAESGFLQRNCAILTAFSRIVNFLRHVRKGLMILSITPMG